MRDITPRIAVMSFVIAISATQWAFAQNSDNDIKNKQPVPTPVENPVLDDSARSVKTPQDASKADDWRVTKLPVDAAFAAYQRGYFVTAFKEAMKRVETNRDDAAAMTLIAELFKDGLGFKRDPAEAARWYKLAAERGDRQAAFALGRAYLEGSGVTMDRKKAEQLFRSAAKGGHGAALYNLGVMALEPRGKEKTVDFAAAAKLFEQAAEAGDLDAAYSLATLYRHGNGVEKDEKRATELLRQAADQKHLAAMTEYGIALFNGRGVEKDEKAGARMLLQAAWRNSPVAQNRVARMYAAGRGLKQDIVEAMTWHIIARASGLKDSWLEDKLPFLTRTQREVVDQKVRKFAGK